MTDTKLSNAEANAKDQLTDAQLETAIGGTGLLGIIPSLAGGILSNVGSILGQITSPPAPTPAGPRPGVGTTQRSN